MTAEQAAWTTVREYELRCKAYEERERSRWEMARWQMFQMLQMQPFIKPASKPKTPQAWIRFPWETSDTTYTREDCKVEKQETEQLNLLLQDFKKRQARK